jgi:hypothetical protein
MSATNRGDSLKWAGALYRLNGVSPNRVFGAPPDFERNVLVAGRILKVEDGRGCGMD